VAQLFTNSVSTTDLEQSIVKRYRTITRWKLQGSCQSRLATE